MLTAERSLAEQAELHLVAHVQGGVDKVFKETKVAFTRGIADIEEEDNADLEFHQHPFTLNNAALQRSVGMKSRRLRDDETETAELSAGSARSDNTDVTRSGNERDVHMAAV